jgi:hypothetical protein
VAVLLRARLPKTLAFASMWLRQYVFGPRLFGPQILYGHHDLHNVDVVCHPNRLRICVGMVCQCFSQMRCTLAMHDDCDVLPYHFPV